jgi:predicted alpha/beta hydrolase family esterase
MTKVIFLPGNGGATTHDNWFPYLQVELTKLGVQVLAEEFPDPQLARREYWIPFLEHLGADENTVLIGHSSGATASMRYAETHTILGSILIGACYSDMGIESEKASGYYDDEWQWDKIRANQKWIAIFASTDDPFIPISQPQFIREQLHPDYFEFTYRGHFMIDHNSVNREFPEVLSYITDKLSL